MLSRAGQNKLPFFVFIGSALEYFDYLLFPLLATVLMRKFFPNAAYPMLMNFVFFSLGAVMKLMGGLVFGLIADLCGRRYAIQLLAGTMSVATFLFGLMPSGLDEAVYLWLFLMLRTVQALSFGGEMPSASTYAYEFDQSKPTINLSYVFIGATIGSIVATGLLSVLNAFLAQPLLMNWGWRIPFLAGGIIGFISFLTRRSLQDTMPVVREQQSNYFMMLRKHMGPLCAGVCILGFSVSLISLNLYLPIYFNKYLHIDLGSIYSAQTIGLVCCMPFMYLAGVLVDRMQWNSVKLFVGISLLFVGAVQGANCLAQYSMMLFVVVWQFFIAFTTVYSMKSMLSILPQALRGMLSGFVYNISFLLVSFLPVCFELLYAQYNVHEIVFYLPAVLACVSMVGMLLTCRCCAADNCKGCSADHACVK